MAVTPDLHRDTTPLSISPSTHAVTNSINGRPLLAFNPHRNCLHFLLSAYKTRRSSLCVRCCILSPLASAGCCSPGCWPLVSISPCCALLHSRASLKPGRAPLATTSVRRPGASRSKLVPPRAPRRRAARSPPPLPARRKNTAGRMPTCAAFAVSGHPVILSSDAANKRTPPPLLVVLVGSFLHQRSSTVQSLCRPLSPSSAPNLSVLVSF
jgi:hypothetical protein